MRTAPTTINVGHLDPGRVSKCSSVDRAESYRTLLERVWLVDADFVAHQPGRSVPLNCALLIVREALLAGGRRSSGPGVAGARHDSATGTAARRSTACAHGWWAGARILRNTARPDRAAPITGTGRRVIGSVNPAA